MPVWVNLLSWSHFCQAKTPSLTRKSNGRAIARQAYQLCVLARTLSSRQHVEIMVSGEVCGEVYLFANDIISFHANARPVWTSTSNLVARVIIWWATWDWKGPGCLLVPTSAILESQSTISTPQWQALSLPMIQTLCNILPRCDSNLRIPRWVTSDGGMRWRLH
jgi:hypothetical protein